MSERFDAYVRVAGKDRSEKDRRRWRPAEVGPALMSINNVDEPAVNTQATILLPLPGAGFRHVISGIAWSYDADPTGGLLTLGDEDGRVFFRVSITKGGPGFFPFGPPLAGGINRAVVITLTAAGAAVTGKLSLLGHWIEEE